MTRDHVYERPATTVLQLEEDCCLLAGSDGQNDKKWNLDNKEFPDLHTNPKEENHDEIDAKKNNSWVYDNDLWKD